LIFPNLDHRVFSNKVIVNTSTELVEQDRTIILQGFQKKEAMLRDQNRKYHI